MDNINEKYKKYMNTRKILTFKYLKKNTQNNNNNYKICIIVPYRNRVTHLKKFLDLFKYKNFDIYIIDQNNADKFNRGLLLNIGYLFAKKNYNYDRFIFHDVDSYPDENLLDFYNQYINYNIHFACNEYKYNYLTFIGGVIGFTKNDFEKINGFPNSFFGWGGEDDAIYNRCVKNNIDIYRPEIGKYILDEHDRPTTFELNKIKKNKILYDLHNWYKDGIKQLLNYYINYKKYNDLDSFLNSFDNNYKESYLLNNINIDNSKKIYFYKIDYLATHFKKYDIIENKDILQKKIINKLKYFKDNNLKYFQHSEKPIYISILEPLIKWNEIKDRILNTYSKPKKTKKIVINDKIENLIKNYFSKYQKGLKKKTLEDTMKFIFDNYCEFLYFRIRDNKLECSFHIYNPNININWYKYLKYKGKNLDDSLLELMEDRGIKYHTLMKPKFIHANNCLLKFEPNTYIDGNPYSYVKDFQDMILETLNKYNVPDSDLLINRKDFAFLRKDNKSAYEHLNTDIITNIKKYWMLGSQSIKEDNLDIPIPSSDEWKNSFNKIDIIKWKDKINKAIFRGSSTGCNNTLDNPRIKLADISYKWAKDSNKKNLIDVSLSSIVIRIKAFNKIIGIDTKKDLEYLVGSYIDQKEQSKYKYIFNIEGNSQAYRFPSEFKKKSVIINVKSEFKMWFEPLLENKINFIEIDNDYNNLYETLIWLKENDKKAKDIAKNGYKFYKENLSQKNIIDYWYFYMYYTNLYTN